MILIWKNIIKIKLKILLENKSFLSVDEVHFSELIKVKNVITILNFNDLDLGLISLLNKIGNKNISSGLKKSAIYFNKFEKDSYSNNLNKLVLEVHNNTNI